MHAALRNIITGVRGVGGEPGDLVRLTCYVVDWTAEKWDEVLAGIAQAQQEDALPTPTPPLTILGVQTPFTPELVVEIEATAVLG